MLSRLIIPIALLVASVPFAAPSHAAEPGDQTQGVRVASRFTAAKTSGVARTDRSLVGRRDSTRISVLVKLAHDSVATYSGGLPGFAATSPSVTGRPLADSPAERAYEQFLQQQEESFDRAVRRVPGVRLGRSLRTVYGGVALSLPANQVDGLLKVPGVVAVQKDEVRRPLTDASGQFIGADVVRGELGGAKNAGKGVIFGVLDTGAWPEHPSFADNGNLGTPPPLPGGRKRTCDFGTNPLTGKKFVCTNKLIGGRAFLDAYLRTHPDETYTSARDSDGHGTHTASTAAGDVVSSATVFGVERGPLAGMAPGAWVSVYKVCGADGCYSSDSAAAVAQAVQDGVKVINFSISGGTDPFTDPVELAFLDAYAAGVFVAASAGNEGPDKATVNHLSPWVTTVAASTQRREFTSQLTLTAADGASLTLAGSSITAGVSTHPVVRPTDVKSYDGGSLCTKPAKKDAFKGKIVVCERGENARVEKGYNVLQGGAVAMILYNPSPQDTETDNHWLPTVHLADGSALVAYLKKHGSASASFTAGKAHDGRGDAMASFSSRGPGGLALKPDVTAPGVQILAGNTPTPDNPAGGPSGEYFQAIAGTSMSGPHVAGAGILLRAAHPSWTPGQVKSALMTTAVTKVVKEDLRTPADPFDVGAGRIAVAAAADPGLTFDESADRMARYADDEVNAAQLNMPSINAPVMPGRLSVVRTVRNVSGRSLSYRLTTTSPKQSEISVSPSSFTIAAGGTARFTVGISSWAPSKQLFGSVRLTPTTPAVPTLHLPVAFVPQQGTVSLTGSCSSSQCKITAANTAYADAWVDLRTTVDSGAVITSASGAMVTSLRSAGKNGVKLAGIVPGNPSLRSAPHAVYKPLAVDPTAIGDEEIINYDVPEFAYAGQKWTRIGVVSDGYLVVGGGTGQDVSPDPNGLPDPHRPNNVLAPFWSDLDGTASDGVRVAIRTSEAGDRWLVAQWNVVIFGTASDRHFQVWLPLSGTTQADLPRSPTANKVIRFAYDPKALPEAPPAGLKFLVGAENAAGSAGASMKKAPDGDLDVPSTAGKAGGSASYTISVSGAPGDVTTAMKASTVPGTTVLHTPRRRSGRG